MIMSFCWGCDGQGTVKECVAVAEDRVSGSTLRRARISRVQCCEGIRGRELKGVAGGLLMCSEAAMQGKARAHAITPKTIVSQVAMAALIDTGRIQLSRPEYDRLC
jgi:hypothetical protein